MTIVRTTIVGVRSIQARRDCARLDLDLRLTVFDETVFNEGSDSSAVLMDVLHLERACTK